MSQLSDYVIGRAVELDGLIDPELRLQIIHGGLRDATKAELNAISDMLDDVKAGRAVTRTSDDQPTYTPRAPLEMTT